MGFLMAPEPASFCEVIENMRMSGGVYSLFVCVFSHCVLGRVVAVWCESVPAKGCLRGSVTLENSKEKGGHSSSNLRVVCLRLFFFRLLFFP